MEDAIVCGGGPAGLAAALWLGRYRRKTVVLDDGRQRNLAAHSSHGYLTRDGVHPDELLELARRELETYDTVRIVPARAEVAARRAEDFVVTAAGVDHVGHRVLLATGVKDALPDIPGFGDLYGRSIFHCSCCDGFEARGRNVIAIGWGEHAAGFAIDLLEWGASVTLVTHGRSFEGDGACSTALHRTGIELLEEEVHELQSRRGAMTGARLGSGRILPATMAFFSIAHEPRSGLGQMLGCALDDGGYVVVGPHGDTSVQGVYAAGDVTPGEQLIQTAAAEGAIAGIACAMSLRATGSRSEAPEPGPDPRKELDAAEHRTPIGSATSAARRPAP
ncbi:MAG: NAD(P)/FAD-dependent oxidoreductase [Actinomycetota bacterium]